MNKYRIGTSVKIVLSVRNLPSTSVEMFVKSDFGVYKLLNVTVSRDTVSGDTVSGTFEAAEQKFIGDYSVVLKASSRSLCVDKAFALVKHTEEVASGNTEVTISGSFLTSPNVVSSYEEWKKTHTTESVQDYWDWLKEDSTSILNRVSDVESNLATERSERERVDTEREGKITAEATTRETEDTRLQGQILQEVSDRQTADAALQSNIDAVRQERIDELKTEKKERVEADNQLSNRLDTETSQRIEADRALENTLNTEIAERKDEDKKLNDALYQNTPIEIGLDEETAEVYGIFREISTVSRTYSARDCELPADIDQVAVNDAGELWSDIVVN